MNHPLAFRIQLTVFLILSLQQLSSACSCYPYESVFCNIVNQGHHVVSAVVLNEPTTYTYLMDVRIINKLHNTMGEDTITVLGQDGVNCGEDLVQFKKQDTLIMALNFLSYNGYWYLEGACGLHFLRLENGFVKGQITDTEVIQPYQQFVDDIFLCLDQQMNVENEKTKGNQLIIFPNPASEILNVRSDQSILSYEIYNPTGRLKDYKNFNNNDNQLQINTNEFEIGVYFLRLRTSKGILTRKFIIEN